MSLVLLALALWLRLLQGRLTQPLPLQHALAFAAIVSGVAAAARWCAIRGVNFANQSAVILRWCPTVALAAIAVALTLPGTALQTLLVVWGLFAAEEIAMHRLHWSTRRREDFPPKELSLPEGTTLRLARGPGSLGVDMLTGALRATFAPEQRNETLHVAFCPPFERVPQMSCRQVAGPAVRIKTTQVLPHGARLELKLDASPVEATNVVVEFDAVAS